MTDALTQAKHRLVHGLVGGPPVVESLIADQWVINSLLQKSVRRGEVEVAQRAAVTFLAQRGSAIWRRFMIIAFEDVGAASPDAVAMTVAASTDANWRKQSGGDTAIAIFLARLLAEAPKSRSAEHPITAVIWNPLFERERDQVGNCSIAEKLRVVDDNSNRLVHRAVAVWCLSGLGGKLGKLSGSDLPRLLETFLKLGVPSELVEATEIGVSRVRDAITLMVPLVWLAANEDRATLAIAADTPCSLVIDDIPMYALDKHTRIGREAIRNLAEDN
jgi:MgsA AAA+ ATPase C terminal